jgi:hypothetical protein
MSDTLSSSPISPVSAPSQPQKDRLNWRHITLVGCGLIVAVIIMVMLLNIISSTPSKTLDAFCSSLKQRDYQTAYAQFSLGYQKKVLEQDFVNMWKSNGVTSCAYSSLNINGVIATATFTDQGLLGTSQIDQITMVKGNDGNWKIDTLETQLQSLEA